MTASAIFLECFPCARHWAKCWSPAHLGAQNSKTSGGPQLLPTSRSPVALLGPMWSLYQPPRQHLGSWEKFRVSGPPETCLVRICILTQSPSDLCPSMFENPCSSSLGTKQLSRHLRPFQLKPPCELGYYPPQPSARKAILTCSLLQTLES